MEQKKRFIHIQILDYDKMALYSSGKEMIDSSISCASMWKNETWCPLHTLLKNQFQVDCRSVKGKTRKLLENTRGEGFYDLSTGRLFEQVANNHKLQRKRLKHFLTLKLVISIHWKSLWKGKPRWEKTFTRHIICKRLCVRYSLCSTAYPLGTHFILDITAVGSHFSHTSHVMPQGFLAAPVWASYGNQSHMWDLEMWRI